MTKKMLIGLSLLAALLLAGTAIAGPAGWGGRGMMGGGWAGGYGPGMAPLDEESVKLQNQLYQKHAELRAVLAAPEVDREKAESLHNEIIKLRSQLSEKRFDTALEYRQNNPNLQAYGGYGCPGGGPGYGGGRGGYGHRGRW
jgi:hypothetical protein